MREILQLNRDREKTIKFRRLKIDNTYRLTNLRRWKSYQFFFSEKMVLYFRDIFWTTKKPMSVTQFQVNSNLFTLRVWGWCVREVGGFEHFPKAYFGSEAHSFLGGRSPLFFRTQKQRKCAERAIYKARGCLSNKPSNHFVSICFFRRR